MSIENIGFLLPAVILFIYFSVVIFKNKSKKSTLEYTYSAKESISTNAEMSFYRKLDVALNNKYIIVPQAHLSAFLEHRVKGQNWKGAFYKINGKSIDFLICDKENMRPLFGIELDDFTHDMKDRVQRDSIVNAMMISAGFKLVRFRVGEWNSPEEILDRINNTRYANN